MSASTSSKTSAAPVRCDSCGEPASPDHIRDRILRLERSTRYRPIHISLLLMCTAPPMRAEDDLYALEMDTGSAESRAYLGGLLACLGIDSAAHPSSAAKLAELQRRGIYLARIVECPPPPSVSDSEIVARYGKTLLTRIAHSYKPKRIALLEPVAPGLAELLLKATPDIRLVDNGKGIEIPALSDARSVARLRAVLVGPNASTGP
jgi:hypothetical protein